MAPERTIIRTTCPRDCYDSCGVRVIIEDGRIRQVTGDHDHFVSRGSLCAKCSLAYNGVWRDPNHRLLRPLKRIGRKGSAVFSPLSWESAISEIAARLKAVVREQGADTILHTHYTGTCSLIAGGFPLRFFNRLGATEIDPDTVCNNAGHKALKYVFGDSLTGFDPRTAKDAKCLVIWGANPSFSAPHVDKYWLPEMPGTTIVIDPLAHQTAKRADIFLQLRPGTDAALAFAMMHVVREEGLVDEKFITEHVLGWDELLPDIHAMTPERGAALTGVASDRIRAAAIEYGRGPSLLWLGQGMQRQPTGGNAFRAAAALCAATGNIGKPGAGLLFLNGSNTRNLDRSIIAAPQLRRNRRSLISHMDLAETLENAERSRALITWNNNILASSPEQSRLRDALSRPDLFHVAIDLFATDTTDYADFILPAASFLEFDDLMFPYFHNVLSVQAKASEPMGESMPNQEIFRRLAMAMNYTEPELIERDSEIIQSTLKQTGYEGTFDSLKKTGTVYLSREPIIPFASLKFPTPSGKIELSSQAAAKRGHSSVPLPHADKPPASGNLRILSPSSEWGLNSSYGNDKKILTQSGPASVLINPEEAAARGMTEGSLIQLENATGRLPVAVKISDDVPIGVAVVYKGSWPKRDPARANVNVLNPGTKTDMGESSAVHGIEARLRLMKE